MLINSQQATWVTSVTAATAIAAAGYCVYASAAPHGPSGGSYPGLAFGIAGTAMMVMAGLLSLRKRVIWRIGSAQLWMKLHIWCSVLAVPLILFHSGWHLGGPLTTALMILFAAIMISGLFGLLVQQFVPAMMRRQLPAETVYGQIPHVAAGLAVDAYEIVASITGPIAEAKEEQAALDTEAELLQKRPSNWKQRQRLSPATSALAGAGALRTFYLNEARKFLRRSPGRAGVIPDFAELRRAATDEWRASVDRLAEICTESAQLTRQIRLHRLLHGWLLLHVPLSFALFALLVVHIYYGLHY